MGTVKVVRKYRFTDFEMLSAVELLIGYCIQYLQDIILKKPAYKDPYFPNLLVRVTGAFSKYLGINNAKKLRDATAALFAIINPAKADIVSFKKNLESDYVRDQNRLKEILNTLGFAKYFRAVSKGAQEGLLNLLTSIRNNLTAELEAEIIAKGMPEDLMARVKGYAETALAANKAQEDAKGKRPIATADAITALNDIYIDASSSFNVVKDGFSDKPDIANLFSIQKAVDQMRGKNISSNNNNGDNNNPAPPPAQ